MTDKTFADRIQRLYGDRAFHDEGDMANDLVELSRLGLAALETGANIDTDYPLAALFRVMGAMADELGERIEDGSPARAAFIASEKGEGDAATRQRLAEFAVWTGTVPPAQLLDADGEPTDALRAYCRENGLSLDWLFAGDAQSLVMQAHHAAKAA